MKNWLIAFASLILIAPLSAQDRLKPADAKGGKGFGTPWTDVPDIYKKISIPTWQVPTVLKKWEKDRVQVRQTLLDCMGKLPTRPDPKKVNTTFKFEKDGYRVERYGCPLLLPTPTDQSCDDPYFRSGAGCITGINMEPGGIMRATLDRHADTYKAIYRQRTSAESNYTGPERRSGTEGRRCEAGGQAAPVRKPFEGVTHADAVNNPRTAACERSTNTRGWRDTTAPPMIAHRRYSWQKPTGTCRSSESSWAKPLRPRRRASASAGARWCASAPGRRSRGRGRAAQARSNTAAMPWPPPMHIVTSA